MNFSNLCFLLITLCCSLIVRGQNLVSNGGFEYYSSLPTSFGQYDRAIGWTNAGSPTSSPDYFHTSGSVPNFFGQITPVAGMGQMGICTYHNATQNLREYISTQLTGTMIAGQLYTVSFYVSQGRNGGYSYSSNGLGCYFSNTAPVQPGGTTILVTPQIEITSILTINNSWQQFSFDYTATGNENFFTMGNFRTDANTLRTATGNLGAYYFIDSIRVVPACARPAAPVTNITQPTCALNTGTITVTSPTGAGFTYSIDGTTYTNTSGVFSGLAPGNYNVTVKNNSGCTSLITVAIVNNPIGAPAAPVVTVTQPTCTISTGTITITSPTGTGFTYSVDGINYSNTSGVFSNLVPGSYNVTVKDNTGCVSAITVSVVNNPPGMPSAPTSLVTHPTCSVSTGSILILSPRGIGFTYSIDGITYANSNGIFDGLAPGSYNVTAMNSSGCTSPVAVVVINNPPGAPVATVTQPTCTVNTGSITITSPTGAGYTYSIDGTSYTNTTGTFIGLAPASYNVSVKDNVGCISPITVAVVNNAPIPPAPPVTTITQPNCSNSTGSITITSPTGAGLTYSIDGTSYTNTTGTFANLSPGSYYVTVKDNNGCISLATVAVLNNVQSFSLQLSANPNPVSSGTPVSLTATGSSNFTVSSWQPASLFPNQTSINQTISISTPTLVTVIGSSLQGCKDTATVLITLNAISGVWISNTFTPNNDGKNDVFGVIGSSVVQVELSVWNRWGQCVFTSKKQSETWDGNYKGKRQPMGNYTYVAKLVLANGIQEIRRGNIMLIR